MRSRTMTLRLDPTTLHRLERLAKATDRSKAWLAAQAVSTYLDLNEWQVGKIRAAVRRANSRAARFVSHDEVDAWLASWGTREEREPPL
jgi:RHH-type transcriptional regulator, rel operon repressor / antitoxin RelB